MQINYSYLLSQMKSKRNWEGETWIILRVSKRHCEVTGFDPIHSGFFMKTQPFQANLANLSCDNIKQNALWRNNTLIAGEFLYFWWKYSLEEGTGKETKMVKGATKKLKGKEEAILPWFIWVCVKFSIMLRWTWLLQNCV